MKDELEKLMDELREIAPELAEHRDSNTFSVPKGYFTKLKAEILEKTNQAEVISIQKKKTNNKNGKIWRSFYTWSVAASILIIVAVFGFSDLFNTKQQSFTFDAEEGLQYMIEHIDELDESIWREVEELAANELTSEMIPSEIEVDEAYLDLNLNDIIEDLNQDEIDQLFEDINF